MLKALVLIAAIVIIVFSEPALNRMDSKSPIMLRISFFLLAFGSLAEIVYLFSVPAVDLHSSVICIGVALLLICNRRKERAT